MPCQPLRFTLPTGMPGSRSVGIWAALGGVYPDAQTSGALRTNCRRARRRFLSGAATGGDAEAAGHRLWRITPSVERLKSTRASEPAWLREWHISQLCGESDCMITDYALEDDDKHIRPARSSDHVRQSELAPAKTFNALRNSIVLIWEHAAPCQRTSEIEYIAPAHGIRAISPVMSRNNVVFPVPLRSRSLRREP